MADLFTSFETSVALRDAGAPQEGPLAMFWCDGFSSPGVHSYCTVKLAFAVEERKIFHPRAFRADEIIEALGNCFESIRYEPDEPWYVDTDTGHGSLHTPGASLAEALAAAWLAVLKEGK